MTAVPTVTALQDLVAYQAARRPDAVALAGREPCSYGELEASANRLARRLRRLGVRPGDRVCLLAPKSARAITAIVGVLKAGGIYVPLDVASPAPRLARMVAACDDRWLLADGPVAPLIEALAPAWAGGPPVVGWLGSDPPPLARAPDFTWDELAAERGDPPAPAERGAAVAHLLFTSGSTGVPKGVMVTHASVLAFLRWAVPYFGLGPEDRCSGHPPLHFDLSTFDLFGTFAAGAALYPVPTELNLAAHRLAQFIRDERLTQWFSVPSVLTFLAKFDAVRPGDFPALRRLLWCGEVLPTPTLRHWMTRLPHVRFTNLYGPTEATIASSYHTPDRVPESDTAEIPIGTACAGEELLVLDEQSRPARPGVMGELYIRGAGLSPGYWRDAEQTDAAFRPNPLPGAPPGDRIYRTGDLARVGADGLVYFLGRADSQIKSRGYRIELGEIEAALHAVPGLRESAVVAIESRGFEGWTICAAFVPQGGSAEGVTPAALREALRGVLPGYMLPARWLELPALPRNANGKVDRPALREAFKAQVAA